MGPGSFFEKDLFLSKIIFWWDCADVDGGSWILIVFFWIFLVQEKFKADIAFNDEVDRLW